MKKLQVFSVLLALGAGFLTGRSTSGRPQIIGNFATDDGHPSNRTRVRDRPISEKENTPEARRRAEIRRAPIIQIPQLVFRSLEVGDPVIRTQLMAELLGKMDAGNFREILAEAERVSNETGREHTEEWILMNIRAGQVAGSAAMDDWKAKGLKSPAAWKTFFGWANTDPSAAQEWMDRQADITPAQREKLLDSLLSGSVIHDPEQAGRMLAALPEEDRMQSLGGFVDNFVDAAGKDGVIDWLKTQQNSDKDSPFTQKATTRVFDRLLWSGANRLNAASMVSDLERLATLIPIDEGWIVRSMGQIRDRRTTGGIELLDQLARSPILKDQPLTDHAWSSAVDFALDRNSGAVDEWLAANPDSPIYQKVSEIRARRSAQ